MLGMVINLFDLLPSLVAFFWLVYIATRHQFLTLAIVLTQVVMAGERIIRFVPTVHFGTFTVYGSDAIALALSAVALTRLRKSNIQPSILGPLAILSGLVVVGTVAWFLILGPQPAANAWRTWLSSLALAWWALTVPRPWGLAALKVIVGVATAAAILQLLAFGKYGFRSASDATDLDKSLFDGRPIWASVALMILIGATSLAAGNGHWTLRRVALLIFLATSVLLAQHRSVWVSGLVCAGVLVMKTSRDRGRFDWARFTLLSSIVMCIGLIVSRITVASSSLSSAASSTSTLTWRTGYWVESLSIDRSVTQWLLGGTLGPSPAYTPDTPEHVVLLGGAHSAYIGTSQSLGIIGVISMLSLLIAFARSHLGPAPRSIPLLYCLGFAAYGIFYGLPDWAFLLMAAAVACPIASRPVRSSGLTARPTVDAN